MIARQELLRDLWNFAATLMTRIVDQTVATLRDKIELDPEQPQLLQTVYGICYRLCSDGAKPEILPALSDQSNECSS